MEKPPEKIKLLELKKTKKSKKDIRKFISDFNEDFEKIFSNKKIYEIAYTLNYNVLYDRDNEKYLDDLEKENISKEFLQKVLLFMISRGLTEAFLLKEKFDLDTNNIPNKFFIEGIKEGGREVFGYELFPDFLDLSTNKLELIKEIGKLGYINIAYDLVIIENYDFPKYSLEEYPEIITNFYNYIDSFDILKKMIIFGDYDWKHLSLTLFENEKIAFDFLQESFNLLDCEKEEFEKWKEKHFFTFYEKLLENMRKNIENFDFTIFGELNFTDITEDNFDLEFENKIKEIIIGLNIGNGFIVQFLDITGQKMNFSISNNKYNFGYSYGLLEKEKFYKEIMEIYNIFKKNLQEKNVDFTILFAKSNGKKEDNTYELENKKAA